MNQIYEVTYSLGQRLGSGTFTGEAGMQYLRIRVPATSGTNAQRMVETMFGGREKCSASTGILVG